MTPWTAFVIGMIVGWLVEWVIDWFFWRKQGQPAPDLRPSLQTAEAEITRLKDQLFAQTEKVKSLETTTAEAETLRSQVQSLQTHVNHLTEKAKTIIITKHDHLEQINGIGPAFAKRLNNAGIYTFAELAALSPQRITEIIAPQSWQKIEPEKWVAEAAELAEEIVEEIKEIKE